MVENCEDVEENASLVHPNDVWTQQTKPSRSNDAPEHTNLKPTRCSLTLLLCLFLVILGVGAITKFKLSPSAAVDSSPSAPVYEMPGDGILERSSTHEDGPPSVVTAHEQAQIEKEEQEQEAPNLNYYVERCKTLAAKNLQPNTIEYRLAAADCGWGYDWRNTSGLTKPWKVALFGEGFSATISDFAGYVTLCPTSPKCHISRTNHPATLSDADVVVIFQNDANHLISRVPSQRNKKQYKVLYWREAQFQFPLVKTQRMFDFEMGVHYYAGLLNPAFPLYPTKFLSGSNYHLAKIPFIPVVERHGKFAMSLISHCHATSQRDIYINHLKSILGPERIHQYGDCGDRKLPGSNIGIATKLMAQYKFFLAFENTIEDGYVTEKLFFSLTIPVLSIYYGALNAPNVTVTPSYIKAADFKTPRDLAEYMLFLDQNPDEYMKYHAWRSDPASFTDEYLERIATKVVGPEEIAFHVRKGVKRFPRTASFCRLCDEKYVKQAAKTRTEQSFVIQHMNVDAIDKMFFAGRMKG